MTEVVPKAPHADCANCPLYSTGTYVPASIPEGGAELAFVGEAPGKQERLRGKVFVGPSGKLVTRIFRHFGLKRSSVLLSNATKCSYPEGEEMPDEAVEACRPQLEAELTEAGVKSVVAMGNYATRSLTGSKVGITRQRVGPPRESRVPGVSVAPTFHPAACLRSADFYPSVIKDVGKVVSGVPALWQEPIIHQCRDVLEVRAELSSMSMFEGPVVVDIETGSDKDETSARGHAIISIALSMLEASELDVMFVRGYLANQGDVRRLLVDFMQDRGVVCQNGKFDTGQIQWLWENHIPLAEDTMLASYALDERRGIHGLKYMAKEDLGAPEYEADIGEYLVQPKHSVADRRVARAELEKLPAEGAKRADVLKDLTERVREPVVRRQAEELGLIEEKIDGRIWWRPDPDRDHRLDVPVDADGTYSSIPLSLLSYYNSCDVVATKLLMWNFRRRLEEAGLTDFYRWLISVSEMLTDVELRGLGVDWERNRKLEERCAQELEKLADRFDFNPRSPQQVLKFLQEGGIPDAEGTSREVLEELAERSAVPKPTRETISELLEYRKWQKRDSTYVRNVRANTYQGRLHPSFKLHGTTTGRLSSSPNVQNMIRGFGIKNQYVPPSGSDFTWVAADYSQAELRVLCWLAQDEAIRELFNDPDRDVFTELSRGMLGDEAFQMLSDYDRKEYRVQVKSFAYGISYGREWKSIAVEFGISEVEARKRMQTFRSMIPDIMQYQKWIIRQVHQGRDLVNPFGRHRRFHLVTEQNARAIEREALSFMPQSTASDITVEAARRANEEGIAVCNLIHDQILAEAPLDEAPDVGRRLEEIMVGAARDVVGGYVEFEAEHSIGREWEKL